MSKRTNRVVWGLMAILAVAVLGGVAALGMRLRPYWIAAHDGEFADLRAASLFHARLRGAGLGEAHLEGADMRDADLSDANLTFTHLVGSDLRNADLTRASVWGADMRGADLRGTKLGGANLKDAIFTGARYDRLTRWPNNFNPQRHGAVGGN
jgi:uncharacterized protein YjbI with pentapeptide repeats